MIRPRFLPTVTVVILSVVGCGSPLGTGEPAPRTAIEACDESREGVDAGMDRVGTALARADTWIDVRDLKVLKREDDRVRVATTAARTRSGRSAAVHELDMPAATADIALRDLEAGLPVVAGLTSIPGGGMAMELMVVFRDGEPLFVGNCLQYYNEELAAFAQRRAQSAASVLDEVADGNRSSKQALAQNSAKNPTSPRWEDQPADRRQIDEGSTPPEALGRLQQVQLNLRLPQAWLAFDALLCPKTSVGWSTCVAFDAETRTGTSGGGPLVFYSYKVPDEPLELWVVGRRDGIRDPRGLIARFAGTPQEQAAVEHEGDPAISSLEQLLDEARSRAVFRTSNRQEQ